MGKKKYDYHFAIEKTFQGFGIMLSFDNGYADRDFILLHVKLLWLNFWIIFYKLNNGN